MKTEIEELAEKASKAEKSENALRFSQAALNLAHVKATLANLPQDSEE